MTKQETIERISDLESLLSQFKGLVAETAEALEGTPEEFRTRRTWLGHIQRALDNQHEFSPNTTNMRSTLNDLRESLNSESSADCAAGNYYE